MSEPVRPGRARRLPADLAILRMSDARHRLPSQLGTASLVMLALGVMIGAGIYSLAGTQAAVNAGPAVVVSFLIAAVVCVLAALSYAELSSTIPAAGSAYTFSYVAFGELWAWLVGWALILELVVAGALVGRVWTAYFVATLEGFEADPPQWLADQADPAANAGWVAAIVVLLLALLVVTGTKASARLLTVIVLAKLAVVAFLVVVGARYVDTDNYDPFVPPSQELPAAGGETIWQALTGTADAFGVAGIVTAASVIVFAYIGFDLIATAAEDAREPRKSVPRAMMVSLAVVTLVYVAMAVVLVGLRPYPDLDSSAPVSDALASVGVGWAADVVNVGALLALTTVILVVLIAQSRVLFAMGRDGLLPPGLARISPVFSSPARAAALAGVAAATLALFPKVAEWEKLLVIGALFAFLFCAVGVIVLRRTQPELERGFRVPLSPLLPTVSALATLWLMLNLTTEIWRDFLIWMAIGLVLYLAYGRRHSHLAAGQHPHRGSHRL